MSDDRSSDRESSEGINALLAGRVVEVGLLAATSFLGGLIEAVFLVGVTRAAFAITEGDESFGVIAGIEMTVWSLILISFALVLARTALGLLSNWQSARLAAGWSR